MNWRREKWEWLQTLWDYVRHPVNSMAVESSLTASIGIIFIVFAGTVTMEAIVTSIITWNNRNLLTMRQGVFKRSSTLELTSPTAKVTGKSLTLQ